MVRDMSEGERTKIKGYTAEKLYRLIPEIYRQQDARNDNALKAIIGIIAEQVNVLEKDIGNLYDNWFIETCDEWITSYIADLLGAKSLDTSRVSALLERPVSQRAYVANTIGYRRRKGTLGVVEQIGQDVTQFKARGVEFFRLLGSTQNLNHVRLENVRTPDLRNTSMLEILNTPFDTIAHTVEVRRISSNRGFYNIPNIGIFLWRLQALPSIDAPAAASADNIDKQSFTFNPLGYDAPIFNLPTTEDTFNISKETDVPVPIRIRAMYDNPDQYYGDQRSISLDVKYEGETKRKKIPLRDIQVCNLSKWHKPETDKVAIDPVLGRISLSKNASDVHVNYFYGFSSTIGGGFYNRPEYDYNFTTSPTIYKIAKRQVFAWDKITSGGEDYFRLLELLRNDPHLSIEWLEATGMSVITSPDKITISKLTNSLSISFGSDGKTANLDVNGNRIHTFELRKHEEDGTIYISKNIGVYDMDEAISLWKKNRDQNAVIEITDSEVYENDISVNLPMNFTLVIVSSQEKRSILKKILVQGEQGSKLVLDGLWINSTKDDPHIKIDPGDMQSIIIRHCTLVPGRNNMEAKAALEMKSFVRRKICNWDNINDDPQKKMLYEFLNNNLNCREFNGETSDIRKDTNSDGVESIAIIKKDKSIQGQIILKGSQTEGWSAIFSILENGEWNMVFEFIINIENDGSRAMYANGGNDSLEIMIDSTISGRIKTDYWKIFTWNDPLQNWKDDQSVVEFLETNFDLPWLLDKNVSFTLTSKNIKAKSKKHSLIIDKNNGTLTIDNKKFYDFIAKGDSIFTKSDARLNIINSIIDDKSDTKSISCHSLKISNTTVFGKTEVDLLDLASNVIFTDVVHAKDYQRGCVRFSYIPISSQTPQRYMCKPDENSSSYLYPKFTSRTYGDPGYAQLHRNIDKEIFENADNGAEMGAFNSLYQPQRLNDLKSLLNDYLRFGLEAGVFIVS